METSLFTHGLSMKAAMSKKKSQNLVSHFDPRGADIVSQSSRNNVMSFGSGNSQTMVRNFTHGAKMISTYSSKNHRSTKKLQINSMFEK